MPCPYANILGEPNTGAHSIRLFGFSVVDIFLTILAAYLISKAYKINFWYFLLGLFILGEILHYIFGTKTAFLKMLGLDPSCV